MLSRGMFALSGYESLPPASAPQPPKDALLNLLRRDFFCPGSFFFSPGQSASPKTPGVWPKSCLLHLF